MRRFLSLISSTTRQVSNSRGQVNILRQETLPGKRFNLVSNQHQQQPTASFSLSATNYLFGKKPSKPGNSSSSSSSGGTKKRSKNKRNQLGNSNNYNNNNNNNYNNSCDNKKDQFGQNKSDFSSKLGIEKAKYGSNASNANGSRGKVNKSSSKSNSGDNYNNNSNSNCDKKTAQRMSANSVSHCKSKKQFVMDLGNNQCARIDYRPIGKGKIEMYHTEVPAELRNRGIGKALAKGALEQAKNDNLKVKVTCSYLVNYLDNFGDENLKSFVEK